MPGTTFLIEDKFLSGTINWKTSDEPELFMKPECLGLAHGKESWWVVSSGLWCRGQMLFVTMSVLGVRVFLDGAFKTFCYSLAPDCIFNSCDCKQKGICLMNFGFALRWAAGQSANEVLLLFALGPWHVEALQDRAQRRVGQFAGNRDSGHTWVGTTIGSNARRSSRFIPPVLQQIRRWRFDARFAFLIKVGAPNSELSFLLYGFRSNGKMQVPSQGEHILASRRTL